VAGQIIIVNGTSGSGKSTACELFVKRSEEFWLLYGIDHFLSATFPAKFSHHGPRCKEGIYAHPLDENDRDGPLRWSFGEWGTKAFQALHEWAAAASRQGCNIILDHLMMTDPPVLQDCIWRLKDLPVLFVTLKPPFEVLMERVATRKMEKKLPTSQYSSDDAAQRARERLNRLRPWFYETIYANDYCDLEIDTVKFNPEEVCDLIEKRLAEGPGTAFEQLRKRHPIPRSSE
jgi:chloramphenicol 3-O-phosphotransferase